MIPRPVVVEWMSSQVPLAGANRRPLARARALTIALGAVVTVGLIGAACSDTGLPSSPDAATCVTGTSCGSYVRAVTSGSQIAASSGWPRRAGTTAKVIVIGHAKPASACIAVM